MASNNLSAVFSAIKNSEYNVRWRSDLHAYGSVNRRQRLYFTFLPNGFLAQQLGPTNAMQHWVAGLRLVALGSASPLRPKALPAVLVKDHTVDFATPQVIYDYTNGPVGMRQTFVIEQKPQQGPLTLVLKAYLRGATMRVDKHGAYAYFVNTRTKREVMRYTDLKVWDANGRSLLAKMVLLGTNMLGITVDDSQAQYPVVIDPLAQNSQIVQTQEASTKFAFSVAAGNTNSFSGLLQYGFVLVGAPEFVKPTSGEEVGAAFVFAENSSGYYTTNIFWHVYGSETNDEFGYSVAVSNGPIGSAYATLNDDPAPDLIVGSPTYGDANQNGAVFVWYGHDMTSEWYTKADWSVVGPAASRYGWSVATLPAATEDSSGNPVDGVLVGAPLFTFGTSAPAALTSATEGGEVLAYYSGTGSLPSSATWSFVGTNSYGELGYSVAGVTGIDGNAYGNILAGEPWNTSTTLSTGGDVDVFAGSSSGFGSSPTVSIPTPNGEIDVGFGFSVTGLPNFNSTTGNAAFAVGAPDWPVNGNSDVGQVFVYDTVSVNPPSAIAQYGPDSSYANSGAEYGYAVAGGDVDQDASATGDLIVGAPYENAPKPGGGLVTEGGWAYVYYANGSGGFNTSSDATYNLASYAYFGASLAWMPDLYTGSQYTTGVLIGAPNAPALNGSPSYGAAYVEAYQ